MCKIVIIRPTYCAEMLLLFIVALAVEYAVITAIGVMRQENDDCTLGGELIS